MTNTVPVPDQGPVPRVGDTVRDTSRGGRVGVVMGHEGPYIQLRPLGGGREWDAAPDRIAPITPSEILSARVAHANAVSRRGRG